MVRWPRLIFAGLRRGPIDGHFRALLLRSVPTRTVTWYLAKVVLLRLRNLDDWARPADRRPGRFFCFHNVGEADAIVLGPDCLEPMTHITPEHERIRGGPPPLLPAADTGPQSNARLN